MSFVSHDFEAAALTTDASLSGTTPDQGAAWVKDTWTGTAMVATDASRVRPAGTASSGAMHIPTAPTNANYRVNMGIRRVSDTGQGMGVKLRHDGGGGTDWIHFWFNDSTGLYELIRVNGGSPTTLQTYSSGIPSVGGDFTVGCFAEDDVYHCYVNGSLAFSYDDSGAGASRITVAGYPGIFYNPGAAVGNTVGLHGRNFEALNEAELGGGGPTVVFSEPVLAEEDESGAAAASVAVHTAAAAVEDEAGAASARVVAFASAAAVEDEVAPEPPDTTIFVRTAADAVEDEVASATGGSNPPGIVFSEPVLAVEDESASASARVLVHSGAGAEEEESAAASAWARVFSSAAAIEDEVADVVEPDLYVGPFTGTVTHRPRLFATITRRP